MKRLTVTSGEAWANEPELVDIANAAAVIRAPLLERLLDFWISRCRDGDLPGRADIEPREIGAEMLPQLVMFDCVERDGRADVRYRLVGTALVDRLGIDATGSYMRDSIADGVHAEQLIRHTHLPVETGSPVFSHGVYVDRETGEARLETKRLTLPLRPLPDGTRLAIACQTLDPRLPFQPSAVEIQPAYRSLRFVRFLMQGRSARPGIEQPG